MLSGGHSIGFSASTNPQVHVLALSHALAHQSSQYESLPCILRLHKSPFVSCTWFLHDDHVAAAHKCLQLYSPILQGTISANSRYFSVKYYRQIILGDAFFGSDKALADNNSTLAIVEQLAADQDLFYKKFTDHFFNLTWLGVDSDVTRKGL